MGVCMCTCARASATCACWGSLYVPRSHAFFSPRETSFCFVVRFWTPSLLGFLMVGASSFSHERLSSPFFPLVPPRLSAGQDVCLCISALRRQDACVSCLHSVASPSLLRTPLPPFQHTLSTHLSKCSAVCRRGSVCASLHVELRVCAGVSPQRVAVVTAMAWQRIHPFKACRPTFSPPSCRDSHHSLSLSRCPSCAFSLDSGVCSTFSASRHAYLC